MGTFSQRLLINTDIMAKVHIKNGLFRVEGIKTANAKKEGREREKKRERKKKIPLPQFFWSTCFIVSAWNESRLRAGHFYGCPEVSKSCGMTLSCSPRIPRLPDGEGGLGVCTPH